MAEPTLYRGQGIVSIAERSPNGEAIDDYAVLIGFANIDTGALDDYAIVSIGFANVNADAIAL